MKSCERCSRPLGEERRGGHCEACRGLCPRCGQPHGRPRSAGYCPKCQRERRELKAAPSRPGQRRQPRPTAAPGLQPRQEWFPNGNAEQRLPVQQITLDIERTARILRTFYTEVEFQTLKARLAQDS